MIDVHMGNGQAIGREGTYIVSNRGIGRENKSSTEGITSLALPDREVLALKVISSKNVTSNELYI